MTCEQPKTDTGEADASPGQTEWAKIRDRRVPFSTGHDKFSDFTREEATLADIAKGFLEHVEQKKKGIGAVSGAVLKDYKAQNPEPRRLGFFTLPPEKGEKRPKNFKDENVDCVHAMVCFDLDNTDGKKRIEEGEKRCQERGLACSSYSTYSHTDENEKARLVVYLAVPIPTDTKEARVIYREAYALIGEDLCPGFDSTCCNPARVIYLPTYNGKTPTFARFHEGGLLDPVPYIEKARLALASRAAGKPHTANQEQPNTAAPCAGQTYLTPWVAKLLGKFAKRLNAANLVRDYFDDATDDAGGVVATCVNGTGHESGKSKSDDMFAMNAADAEAGVFVLKCLHATCERDLPGGGYFLDRIIQAFSISLPTLMDYVEAITDDERLNMMLPDGFTAEGGFIHAFKRVKVHDEYQNIPEPICSTLLVTGHTRNELAAAWGCEVAFKDRDRNEKRFVVTAELLHGDGGTLFTELSSAGLWIGEDTWARQKLKRLLNTWNSNDRITDYSKPGWHGMGYMTPCGEPLGFRDGGTYRLRSGAGVQDVDKGGTLQGWKDGVGHAVWTGDTLQFAFGCMTGVAGVLVQLAGLDTIGIHFLGASGKGKTISQICGASCVANPEHDKGVLFSARATDNALEGKFEKGNGSSAHLDEAKTANAKIMELLIFMAASGVGKARMKQDTTLRVPKSWSTCWTFSSEKSLAAILGSVDDELVTGGVVRLMTVPLETCPDIGKERADTFKAAARANYGWALPVFVGEVMKQGLHNDRAKLIERINAYAERLPASSVAEKRARQVFGMLWLVGELMKACGLVPADANVEGVIRWGWTGYIGAAEMLEPMIANVRAIETYLRTNVGVTVFKCYPDDDDPRPHREVKAWYDATTVYLRADVVEGLPGVTLSRNEVATALKEGRLLDEPPASARRTTHQFVPGVGRINHYRLKMVLAPSTLAEHLETGANPFVAAAAAAGVH